MRATFWFDRLRNIQLHTHGDRDSRNKVTGKPLQPDKGI